MKSSSRKKTSIKNKSLTRTKGLTRRNLSLDFEEADEACPICQNTIVEGTGRLTNCCHKNVHIHCLDMWRNHGVNGIACPLCRRHNYGGRSKKRRRTKRL